MNEKTPNEELDSVPSVQEIVERYLTEVEWLDGMKGRAPCPGRHKHSTRSTKNDCWVFINGVPTVTCLHDKCRDEIASANDKIRAAWNLFQPPVDEDVLREAKEKAAERYALEEKARASLPEILKQFKWDVEEISNCKESPKGQKSYHTTDEFLTKMFKPEDLVWVGDPESTGKQEHHVHFKERREWTESFTPDAYGNYTCASTFKPGTYSRANINVVTTPYMIVEGDKVLGSEPKTDDEKLENKNACGAIFNWLHNGCGLRLRAIVDSGNKSLHAWWDTPAPAKFDELKIVLPAMGCDRAMFKPTQPARLPGCIRDNGKEQKLLWIS